MRFSLRHVVIVVVLLGAVAGLASINAPGERRTTPTNTRGSWLEFYQAGAVNVTFVTEPVGIERVTKAVLVRAEISGVVLRFPRKQDTFYPYANIISIEPL